MKKIIRIFALVLVIGTMAWNVQAQKFGYINSNIIVTDMTEFKQANANLEALQKQLTKKGQQMLEDYQRKLQGLQQKEQNGEISPKQLEEEAVKLREEEQKLQSYQQDMYKQVKEKETSLLQPILDRVNTAIKEVAKENGYQFIFDASQGVLLYADETQDVSALVKTKLGI